jgi:hypothetical protein
MINAADRLRLVRLNRNALANFLPRRYAPPRAPRKFAAGVLRDAAALKGAAASACGT